MSSHPCFRRRWLLQVCLGKAFPQKHAFVDTSVFLSLRKQQPRFAQGQPKKEFHRTSKVLLKWMLIERWIRPSMLSSMCQHVSRLQFDSAEERQAFWNSHDGLNLTCLDQCHGVCSHGTSSSQGWRKRIVIQQSEFDPWHILFFRRRWLLQVCLGRPSHENRRK